MATTETTALNETFATELPQMPNITPQALKNITFEETFEFRDITTETQTESIADEETTTESIANEGLTNDHNVTVLEETTDIPLQPLLPAKPSRDDEFADFLNSQYYQSPEELFRTMVKQYESHQGRSFNDETNN